MESNLYTEFTKVNSFLKENSQMGIEPWTMAEAWQERLRAALEAAEAKGLQQKQLSIDTGIAPANISRLKNFDPNPTISTILPILRRLSIKAGAIFDDDGELAEPRITPYDNPRIKRTVDLLVKIPEIEQRRVLDFAEWALRKMGEGSKEASPSTTFSEWQSAPWRPTIHIIEEQEGFRFPVSPKDFIEKDFDYPQPYHYWRRVSEEPDQPAALPSAADSRGGAPVKRRDVVRMLNPRDAGDDVREIFDRVHQIVRVVGDSMESEYLDGDLLRVDTRIRDPHDGEPVAVYCEALGGSLLGVLRRNGNDILRLEKVNKKHPDVTLPRTGWILLGPVVELVSRKRRRENA